MKNIKKYKWLIIGLLMSLLVVSIIKTRQNNHNAVSFVASITNELQLIGRDGRPMLSGAECIEITKHLQYYAATSSRMDFDDIKDVMQFLNDGGGMADISTGDMYEQNLVSVLRDLEILSDIFQTDDYVYLTNELVSFQKFGFSLESANSMMKKTYDVSKFVGMSYEEMKREMEIWVKEGHERGLDDRLSVQDAIKAAYDYKILKDAGYLK